MTSPQFQHRPAVHSAALDLNLSRHSKPVHWNICFLVVSIGFFFTLIQFAILAHARTKPGETELSTSILGVRRRGTMGASYVINLGLPKTGSSTLHSFFQCGGFSSSHWRCGNRTCAGCISENLKRRLPPFAGCGEFQVWSQMDDPNGDPRKCFFPQVDALENLYRHYPDAIYLLPKRNPGSWVRSVQSLSNSESFMGTRIMACNFMKGPIRDLRQFYLQHIAAVRNFAKENPGMILVEYDIDRPTLLFGAFADVPTHC